MFYAAVSAQPSQLTWFTFEYGLRTLSRGPQLECGPCGLLGGNSTIWQSQLGA